LRSRDTVERVLQRFLQGGSTALPPRPAPGRVPTVTPEWKAELLRVIDLDPPTVGGRSAHWTTSLWATYLAAKTQVAVTAEPVRLSLRAAGGVCKRPTCTLQRKAQEQPGYVGNACGWR
jgi:transposase